MTPLFGEQDFIVYSAAFQIFVQGHNPYDPALMQAVQCKLAARCENVLLYYNPPWLLLILAPVLWFPFGAAAKMWVVAAVAMAAVSAWLLADCYGASPRARLYAFAGVFINVPLFLSAGFGQTGALLLLASTLFIHARVKSHSVPMQAIALFILSVKPHLFLLVFIALLWDEARRRRFAVFGATAGIIVSSVVLITVVNPVIVAAWLGNATSGVGGGVIGLTEWNTPTIGNLLRLAARSVAARNTEVLLFATPLAASVGLIIWLWRCRTVEWRRTFPPLLALSLWVAPYGWAYDWAMLGVLQGALASCLAAAGRNVALWLATGGFIAVQFLAGYLTLGRQLSLVYLVWMPAALLGLWFVASRSSGKSPRCLADG